MVRCTLGVRHIIRREGSFLQRDRQRPTPRHRRPGGGAKGVLSTPEDKLVFLLFYFRQYPTQEVLAFLFGFSQGQACQWIHRLTPIVTVMDGHPHTLSFLGVTGRIPITNIGVEYHGAVGIQLRRTACTRAW